MNEPIVKALQDGESWELVDDFVVNLKSGQTVFVPAGFQFDFASIPRIAWTIVGSPATGKHRYGAIAHDWAVYMIDWDEAAEIFLEVMEASGTNWFKRMTMYWAVRAHKPFRERILPARIEYLKKLQAERVAETDIELGCII